MVGLNGGRICVWKVGYLYTCSTAYFNKQHLKTSVECVFSSLCKQSILLNAYLLIFISRFRGPTPNKIECMKGRQKKKSLREEVHFSTVSPQFIEQSHPGLGRTRSKPVGHIIK